MTEKFAVELGEASSRFRAEREAVDRHQAAVDRELGLSGVDQRVDPLDEVGDVEEAAGEDRGRRASRRARPGRSWRRAAAASFGLGRRDVGRRSAVELRRGRGRFRRCAAGAASPFRAGCCRIDCRTRSAIVFELDQQRGGFVARRHGLAEHDQLLVVGREVGAWLRRLRRLRPARLRERRAAAASTWVPSSSASFALRAEQRASRRRPRARRRRAIATIEESRSHSPSSLEPSSRPLRPFGAASPSVAPASAGTGAASKATTIWNWAMKSRVWQLPLAGSGGAAVRRAAAFGEFEDCDADPGDAVDVLAAPGRSRRRRPGCGAQPIIRAPGPAIAAAQGDAGAAVDRDRRGRRCR